MIQRLKFKTGNSTPPNLLFSKEGVPFDAVRPELVEGWNGSQDRPKAGAFDSIPLAHHGEREGVRVGFVPSPSRRRSGLS
jgi:hypothetical protein